MANSEIWTIQKLLEWTENHFKGKNFDTPRLDAQILLAHSLQCKKIDLYVRSQEQPGEEILAKFRQLVKQRSKGCPVAYLVGHKEFYQLDFLVDQSVLIPRPETEFLVIEALKLIQTMQKNGIEKPKILDLATGSGIIAISIAQQIKKATLIATDLSQEALAIAQKNAEKNQVSEQIEFLQGNLFEALSSQRTETESPFFHMILSNPPYVTREEYELLDAEVKEFEPKIALFAGEDGLDFYREIANQAKNHLHPKGNLILEIGAKQATAVCELLKSAQWENIRQINDGNRIIRVISAQKSA